MDHGGYPVNREPDYCRATVWDYLHDWSSIDPVMRMPEDPPIKIRAIDGFAQAWRNPGPFKRESVCSVTLPTFRQLATLLGGTNSASSMAAAEGLQSAPHRNISVRAILSFHPKVISIAAASEPGQPRTAIGAGYLDGPAALLDSNAAPMDCKATTTDGRLNSDLRVTAQVRDGNAILRQVADRVVQNLNSPGSSSQELLTAMTQLAVTGSSAFAAWSASPTTDLTSYLVQQGATPATAGTANQQIMSDFNAARQAVRNPAAGINETALRKGLKYNWIAVSGEDDPPDFPVNVDIANYPQYHFAVNVPTPQGVGASLNVNIRYIIASSQGTAAVSPTPSIPPGNEVVLFIHGEGSRSEEAADFIPALLSEGAAAGRSFTVVAFDQPSCGYSTMVPHLSVAPMPPTSGVSGLVDTSSFSGSPILDFVENAIVAFVEGLVVPFGNPITAIVGGSLGGHMGLRLAASQKSWVKSVIVWSPASVMDHDFTLGLSPADVTLSQRLLTDPVLASRATADEASPAWPASPEPLNSRSNFFTTVWCKDTFNPTDFDIAGVAGALVSEDVFSGPFALATSAVVAIALAGLSSVPPQPQLWYRDDWASKPTYVEEARAIAGRFTIQISVSGTGASAKR